MRLHTETRINLLPWRDWRRAWRRKATVGALLGAALAGTMLVVLLGLRLEGRIAIQESRNRHFEQELAALDSRIEEARGWRVRSAQAAALIALIRELRDIGSATVRVLDALATTLTEGVHYRRIARRGPMLDVVGVAGSNGRIAGLMRNLDGSAWFASANLKRLREESDGVAGAAVFEMTFLQVQAVEPVIQAMGDRSGSGRTAEIAQPGGMDAFQQSPMAPDSAGGEY